MTSVSLHALLALGSNATVCYFPGAGWENVLLKGDEAASEATEASSADMTIKVRHPSLVWLLQRVSRGKRASGRPLGGKMSSGLHSSATSLCTEVSASEISWNLGCGLGSCLKARIQDVISDEPVVGSLYVDCLQVVTPPAQGNESENSERRSWALPSIVKKGQGVIESLWSWLKISTDVSGKAANGPGQLEPSWPKVDKMSHLESNLIITVQIKCMHL